jgi:hypothetical protein
MLATNEWDRRTERSLAKFVEPSEKPTPAVGLKPNASQRAPLAWARASRLVVILVGDVALAMQTCVAESDLSKLEAPTNRGSAQRRSTSVCPSSPSSATSFTTSA